LAKNADERWQSAGDLADELKWISTESGVAAASPLTPVLRGSTRRISQLLWRGLGALGLLLAGAVFTWGWMRYRTVLPDAQAIQFSIGLPDGWGFASQVTGASTAPIAISPDGRTIAFAAKGPDKKTVLWLRALNSPVPRQLEGTEGASSPFWSPD